MMMGLLSIIVSYGLGIWLVHILYAKSVRQGKQRIHYVLVTRNNEQQMEWYLRSLLFISWLKGKAVMITIWDEGSVDTTPLIIEKLAKMKNDHIELIRSNTYHSVDEYVGEMEQEHIIWIRLDEGGAETKKFPFVMW
ncbi:MAG: hypothetical protein A2189_08340 [Paenibacillus sp. RIFOXYA1_FULL_44_5]|nr:MAG: hypothetical protein A2189_08340 [Paenibacillus sp. RIFOXYA1_FULL_44_5]